jgi:hypothetical protein
MPADGAAAPRRRPAPVTILAALQLVTALLLGLSAVGLVLDPAIAPAILGDAVATGDALQVEAAILAAAYAAMAVLEVVAAVALLRLHRLGWTLAMLLAGVSLASAIATWWFTGEVVTKSMLLGVATVLYLNQRQVRAAFDMAGDRGADLGEERG